MGDGLAGVYVGDGRIIHFTRGMDRELGTNTSWDYVFSSSNAGPAMAAIPCEVCGTHSNSHGVVESCLDCFVGTGALYRFNYGTDWLTFLAKVRGGTCTTAACEAPEAAVHRARYLLQHGFGKYHLMENNCEDFALYCKTELLVLDKQQLGSSSQIAALVGAPLSAAISVPLRFNVYGLVFSAGLYCAGRLAHDVGIRKGTMKISVEDLVSNLQHVEQMASLEVVQRMAGVKVL
eukprot:jgi/Mesen1/8245/ME000443S07388